MKTKPLFPTILILVLFVQLFSYSNPIPKKSSQHSLANIAPVITATGNQTYCPLSSVNIVNSIYITDPDDTGTDAIYIQISSGYVNGEDILKLNHPELKEPEYDDIFWK